MRNVMASLSKISACVYQSGIVAVWLGLVMTCSAYAADVTVSETSFTCIRDGHKIRNTYIRHADPEQLKEAIRIFRDSIPDKEYPVGTMMQLVPFEAMVKHRVKSFPRRTAGSFSRWISPRQAPRSEIGVRTSSISRKGRPVSVVMSLRLSSTSYAKRGTVVRLSRSMLKRSPRSRGQTFAVRPSVLDNESVDPVRMGQGHAKNPQGHRNPACGACRARARALR